MPDAVIDAARAYLSALDHQSTTYIKTARNAPSEQDVAWRKRARVQQCEQELRDAVAAHDQEQDA